MINKDIIEGTDTLADPSTLRQNDIWLGHAHSKYASVYGVVSRGLLPKRFMDMAIEQLNDR